LAGGSGICTRITCFITVLYTVTEGAIIRALNGCPGLTVKPRITKFHAIAELGVIAGSVVGDVFTTVLFFIAGVGCTGDPVVADNRRAGLACSRAVTGFRPVAVHAVRAGDA
jgi:hypothetical protein